MRANIHRRVVRQIDRAKVVEEHKGAAGSDGFLRQSSSDEDRVRVMRHESMRLDRVLLNDGRMRERG